MIRLSLHRTGRTKYRVVDLDSCSMKGLMIPCDGDSRINVPEKNISILTIAFWVLIEIIRQQLWPKKETVGSKLPASPSTVPKGPKSGRRLFIESSGLYPPLLVSRITDRNRWGLNDMDWLAQNRVFWFHTALYPGMISAAHKQGVLVGVGWESESRLAKQKIVFKKRI